jgi:hypothetical protein
LVPRRPSSVPVGAARDVYGAASITFGEGEFDHQSIYVSTTFNGGRGGKIWRIPVGVAGQVLHR